MLPITSVPIYPWSLLSMLINYKMTFGLREEYDTDTTVHHGVQSFPDAVVALYLFYTFNIFFVQYGVQANWTITYLSLLSLLSIGLSSLIIVGNEAWSTALAITGGEPELPE